MSAFLLNLDDFGEDFTLLFKDVDENSKIYVEYNGKEVAFYCNYFKFRGKGDDILDEYSVCVTPLNYSDNDCAVEKDIKTSLSGVTQHVCIYMHHTIKYHIWYQLNTFQ